MAHAWDGFEPDLKQAASARSGSAPGQARIDGGGSHPGLAAAQAERRRREVSAVLREVGEPGASVLWHVVGMAESLWAWALRSGWNGRWVDPPVAEGILIQALAAPGRIYAVGYG